MLLKLKIFDLWFAAAAREQIKQHVARLADTAHASSVIFANAHVIVESHWNANFKETLQRANFIVPDGVPIAWILRAIQKKSLKGKTETAPFTIERYSGPDLMEDIFKAYPGKKHFFLGSTPETLEKIRSRFKLEYKTDVAGIYSPPFASEFSEEEKRKQLEIVKSSGAEYVWVGLGAPKQEKHVIEMAERSNAARNGKSVWLAVGAAFDFYGGQKPRAPKLMQNAGMEWAFRMASDPGRLASRYFKTNPVFIQLALKEILKYRF